MCRGRGSDGEGAAEGERQTHRTADVHRHLDQDFDSFHDRVAQKQESKVILT
jgi:hypothetical protein